MLKEILLVNGNPMEVFLFEPSGEGLHPGLILAQHIPVGHTGIENDAFTLRTAERFAEQGYHVAVPFIFHWWGGRVAWLGVCHISQLAACAIIYGGRIKLAMGEGQAPAIELADRIHCPLAGFFGNEDENPTPDDVDDSSAALTRAGVAHQFHRYDEAGHAFQNFPTPDRYREVQSEDAWEKVLTFLSDAFAAEA